MWRSCLRNKIERVAAFRDRTRPVIRHRLPVRPVPQQAGRALIQQTDRTVIQHTDRALIQQTDRAGYHSPPTGPAIYDKRLPTGNRIRFDKSLFGNSILTHFLFSSSSHPLLTSTSHLLFLSLSLPRCTFSLFLTLLCILSLHPRLSSISRLTLPSSSFIRPLSPSSLCHSSLLLHLAPLIISSSIIPSSSFSLSSSVLHPLHARSPVLCCVSRVRHAPRPKGFTNRRRVTTLPLPALLRRAPAVRRTRAWPCG